MIERNFYNTLIWQNKKPVDANSFCSTLQCWVVLDVIFNLVCVHGTMSKNQRGQLCMFNFINWLTVTMGGRGLAPGHTCEGLGSALFQPYLRQPLISVTELSSITAMLEVQIWATSSSILSGSQEQIWSLDVLSNHFTSWAISPSVRLVFPDSLSLPWRACPGLCGV